MNKDELELWQKIYLQHLGCRVSHTEAMRMATEAVQETRKHPAEVPCNPFQGA